MGNLVLLALREDHLENLKAVSLDAINSSMHDTPVVPRFMFDGKPLRGELSANAIDGLMVSHYHHYDDAVTLYVSPEMMFIPSMLYGENISDASHAEIAKMARSGLGRSIASRSENRNDFSLLKSKTPAQLADSSSSSRVHLLAIVTDFWSRADGDSTMERIINAIQDHPDDIEGHLPYRMDYLGVIEKDKAAMLHMHKGVFKINHNFPLCHFPSMREEPNVGGREYYHYNLMFAKDFFPSIGYELKKKD